MKEPRPDDEDDFVARYEHRARKVVALVEILESVLSPAFNKFCDEQNPGQFLEHAPLTVTQRWEDMAKAFVRSFENRDPTFIQWCDLYEFFDAIKLVAEQTLEILEVRTPEQDAILNANKVMALRTRGNNGKAGLIGAQAEWVYRTMAPSDQRAMEANTSHLGTPGYEFRIWTTAEGRSHTEGRFDVISDRARQKAS